MAATRLSDTGMQSVTVHLTAADRAVQLAADVRNGLTATPKELPPKWFYDEAGGQLFDKITRLPEHYPTRRERAVLTEHADEIAAFSRADTLVELGSGTSEKTRLLLDALHGAGTLRRFVPFDVDEAVLRQVAATMPLAHPTLQVTALVGDFDHHLGHLPRAEAGWWCFSAARSATCARPSGTSSCPGCGPRRLTGTCCCSAPTW